MTGRGELFRGLQILFAVLGLAFSSSSQYLYWLLIVFYAGAVIYILMIVICMLASKSQINHTWQAIIEVAIGVTIIIYTIYVAATSGKDTWLILSIVVGFILPALLFITAYDKT